MLCLYRLVGSSPTLGTKESFLGQFMKTKFILHGGTTKGRADEKDSKLYAEILREAPQNPKVLLVFFAKEDERVEASAKKVTAEFERNKWQAVIRFERATKASFEQQVRAADVIYFHGGKTLRLLEALKDFPNLKNSLKGKIVAGESAGANMLAEFYYSPSSDKIGEGLGILPLKIIPHYLDQYRGKLDRIGTGLEEVRLREYELKAFEIDG